MCVYWQNDPHATFRKKKKNKSHSNNNNTHSIYLLGVLLCYFWTVHSKQFIYTTEIGDKSHCAEKCGVNECTNRTGLSDQSWQWNGKSLLPARCFVLPYCRGKNTTFYFFVCLFLASASWKRQSVWLHCRIQWTSFSCVSVCVTKTPASHTPENHTPSNYLRPRQHAPITLEMQS